jgi:HPt (histidine-containing phosphotransfer) domain-containing protein
MTDDTGEADLLFEQLRQEYLAESRDRLAALEADIDELRRGVSTNVAGLRGRLHQLAGSGGSYGFPAVSAIAREAELWLASVPAPGTLVARLEETVAKLAQEFERAKAKK